MSRLNAYNYIHDFVHGYEHNGEGEKLRLKKFLNNGQLILSIL